ncbi:hypothetical protein HZH68_008276 [Vespula germanica]|uniref:Prohormone-1 n=1 Tax=Vespula germanica TaxID=30212 RepID=A0A834K3F8_VESGE|nr:hypothetical protein HZH68_008276 [Vespula germanica]
MSLRTVMILAVILIISLAWATAYPIVHKTVVTDKDLVDHDDIFDAAIFNYLFTKQIIKRLRNQLEIGDLHRKRSYWKQCAFNAVSCFGK